VLQWAITYSSSASGFSADRGEFWLGSPPISYRSRAHSKHYVPGEGGDSLTPRFSASLGLSTGDL
jgi:hypothetical protein